MHPLQHTLAAVRRHRGPDAELEVKGARFSVVEDMGFGLGVNVEVPGAARCCSTRRATPPRTTSDARLSRHATTARDVDRGAVVRRDQRLREDVGGRSVGETLPVSSSTMRSAYCAASVRSCIAATSEPGLRAQPVEELERLLLMPDVERGGRLVEEDDLRLLRERARDDDALLLTAGERPEAAVGEREEVEPRERARRRVAVARALLRERAEVRRPAEEHVLRDRHPGRSRRLLRDDGDEPRELRACEVVDRAAVERDLARERDEPRDRAQQRRLAGAVRADEREPLAVGDDRVDARRRPACRRARP